MCGGKGRSGKLCPFSFGLALGITAGLAAIVMSLAMMHGMVPMHGVAGEPLTWSAVGMHFLWGLVKGFVFGFVLAILYDLISCCCVAKCCRKSESDKTCGCGCACCKPEKK